MKRTSRILVLAGMALASMAFVRQEGNLLRLTLKENTTDTYKLETKVKQTVNAPTGEQEIGISTTSTYKVSTKKVDADKGTAEVSIETIVDKIEGEGPFADAIAGNKPKPTTLSGKLNTRGHLDLDLSKAGAATMMMGAGQQSGPSPVFVELPEKAVKVGDTWEVIVPKGPFTGPADQKLTAKLVGEKKLDDQDVWVIATTGTLNIDVDSSKLPKGDGDSPLGGQNVKVKGTTELNIENLVEKSTGRTLRSETKTKTKSNIEVVDFGINVESTGTSTTVATLQKG